MKTKMIILITVIIVCMCSCGMKDKLGKKEEPVKEETKKEEVAKKESIKEEQPIAEKAAELTAPSGKMVSVTGPLVNIRNGPGMKHKVLTTVKEGDELEVLGEIGSWYNVKLPDGTEGWIYHKLVK
jgi:SH3-like domain-containing protein